MQYKIKYRVDWIKQNLISSIDYTYTANWLKYKQKYNCCRATFSKDWILAQREYKKYVIKREHELLKIDLYYHTKIDLKDYFVNIK